MSHVFESFNSISLRRRFGLLLILWSGLLHVVDRGNWQSFSRNSLRPRLALLFGVYDQGCRLWLLGTNGFRLGVWDNKWFRHLARIEQSNSDTSAIVVTFAHHTSSGRVSLRIARVARHRYEWVDGFLRLCIWIIVSMRICSCGVTISASDMQHRLIVVLSLFS